MSGVMCFKNWSFSTIFTPATVELITVTIAIVPEASPEFGIVPVVIKPFHKNHLFNTFFLHLKDGGYRNSTPSYLKLQIFVFYIISLHLCHENVSTSLVKVDKRLLLNSSRPRSHGA